MPGRARHQAARCLLLILTLFLALQVPSAGGQTSVSSPAAPPIEQRYQQALHLLEQGQPQAARLLLEEIVAEQPGFAGAWLDLALAAHQSGDTPAALEHLVYLRQQFPLSPALAQQIEHWEKTWQQAPQAPGPGAWQGDISLDLGHSNNVNGGLAQEQITLTIPGGQQATLPLAPEQRPRGDAYTQLGLQAWRRWALEGGSLYPLVRLRARQMHTEKAYDQLDLQGGLIYQTQPDPAGRAWQASLLLQHDTLGGKPLLQTGRLLLQRLHDQAGCRLAWGGELEYRRYPDLPLNGRLLWLNLGLACKTGPATQLGGQLRGGHEQAQAGQPGGNTRQYELALQGSHRLGQGSSLELQWQHSHSQDQQGYSPLLQDNAPRQLRRQQFSLALRHPLGAGWEARFALELQQQRSNLALFTQRARQLSLGVSRGF